MEREKKEDALRNAKRESRAKFLRMLKRLTVQDVERRSRHVEDTLSALPLFRTAQKIMGFYPLAGEPDVRRMMRKVLEDKKELLLPAIDEKTGMLIPCPVIDFDHLIDGPYNTKQPHLPQGCACASVLPDAVLVPGLAFTPQGDRLGRGKGYYDRFLAVLPGDVATIGVCFSFQLVKDLPMHSSRDKRVRFIVTD